MRRSLGAAWAALALALGSALVPRPATAATKLVFGKAAAASDPMLPVDVGVRRGLFEKHGLDVEIVNFTGGSKMAQALTAGSIDIAGGAGIQMALVVKGAPMLAVCESSSTIPFLGIGVLWDSPIASIAALKGKTIGVSSPGALTDWLAQELTRKEGWGPDGVTRVAIGNSAASIAAGLRDHLVDAYVGGTSLFFNLEEQRIARMLIPVSDYEGPVASGVLYASNRLMGADPGAIRAFLAGWLETIDYVRAHKAETVAIESAATGLPVSVMAKEYDLTIGMFTPDCKFDAESLATLRRSFLELKLLDASPDMAKLYTEAYLPK